MMMRNKLFAGLIIVFFLVANNFFINPNIVHSAGASLYLSPSSGTHVLGSNFNVSIKVNSGAQVINAAEGVINFDAALLEVVGVSKSGSIFPFWTVEPNFNNSQGAVSFGGGLPPPAFSGTAGHIITVTFKAKKVGSASVRLVSGGVLANDGKGTNILEGLGSGSYTIAAKSQTPAPSKAPSEAVKPTYEPDYNKPEIRSSSHPDQNRWYNINNLKFEWELGDSISGISIVLDDNPATDPGPASDGLFSEKEYADIEDGVWYLHLKFKDSVRWGSTAHFRVMIDTVPPEPFTVELRQVETGNWPELMFETEDKASGMEKYEIFIGSLDKQAYEKTPEETTLKTSGLHVGMHTALVKAIDKAGNERISTIEFTVEPIEAPVIKDYSREIKSSDRFFAGGTAVENAYVIIYLEQDHKIIKIASTTSGSEGNWFYIHDDELENGRYAAWAEAVNKNGIKSGPSEKISFLVSPPVFAVIGDYVINYFTVFVSLLFMIILIILAMLYLIGLARKKLRKETIEAEEVLANNARDMKKAIDEEFAILVKPEGKSVSGQQLIKIKDKLKKKVDENKSKTLKELKDLEDILK